MCGRRCGRDSTHGGCKDLLLDELELAVSNCYIGAGHAIDCLSASRCYNVHLSRDRKQRIDQ